MTTVQESGMKFGPYDDDTIYQIEKSTLFENVGAEVKTVEFILQDNDNMIYFVEAKSSSPREENRLDFNKFIQDIKEKFIHGINLYYAGIVGRHADSNDIPPSFRGIQNENMRIVFILVINGHQLDWLPPLQVILDKELKPYKNIWKSSVLVLNETLAAEQGLIRGTT